MENAGPNREEYFAQWDVVILNPIQVEQWHISLGKIRDLNPKNKILAWVPFGQSSEESRMSWTFQKLQDYFLKSPDGALIITPWGGKLMNPRKNNFAWSKQVISFVENNYLIPDRYDGIMFDCTWEKAPTWWSPSKNADISDDNYRKGVLYLFQTLRTDKPDAIITGNSGTPWAQGSPYYRYANGPMAENAFGNEFPANSGWGNQMGNYLGAINSESSRDFYYFMIGDLQYNRTIPQASSAKYMSETDKRRFRLALTTTLLGDGFFGFDRGDNLHGQVWWFDEYNVDLGEPLSGYEAPHSYRTNAYHKGTYSREF